MKSNYPKVNTMVNIIKPALIPILSKKIPPKRGRIMFGMEYTV